MRTIAHLVLDGLLLLGGFNLGLQPVLQKVGKPRNFFSGKFVKKTNSSIYFSISNNIGKR